MTSSAHSSTSNAPPQAGAAMEHESRGSSRISRGSHVVRGRWVALPAAFGAVAHLWALLAHPHGVALNILMVAMAASCALCAVEAWRTPNARGFRMLITMSIAMALVHVALVFGAAGVGASMHAQHLGTEPAAIVSGADAGLGSDDSTAVVSMLGIAGFELSLAFCAAVAIRMRALRRISPQERSAWPLSS